MPFADAQTGGEVQYSGVEPIPLTLAGTVKKGDLIGYSSGWKRTLATVGTAIGARFIAGQDGTSGEVIDCYRAAIVKGRFSGGTPGAPIYAAEGSDNGKYTETKPSTSGDVNNEVGFMLAADTAYVDIAGAITVA